MPTVLTSAELAARPPMLPKGYDALTPEERTFRLYSMASRVSLTPFVRGMVALGAPPVDLEYVEPQHGRTPLLQAVAHHAVDNVAALLGAGANPNVCTSDGLTVWSLALEPRSSDQQSSVDPVLAIVDLLIQAGANVNQPAPTDGWFPLHHAAQRTNYEAMERLVQAGASLTVCNTEGRNLLHTLAWHHRLNNDTSDQAIVWAQRCVEAGVDVNASTTSFHGTRPLDCTVVMDSFTEALIRWGATPHASDWLPRLVLNTLRQRPAEDVARMAWVKGFGPLNIEDPLNRDDVWPIHALIDGAQFNPSDRLQALAHLQRLAPTVSLQTTTYRHRTTLHLASVQAHVGLIRRCAQEGVDVDGLDDEGQTPLALLVRHAPQASFDQNQFAAAVHTLLNLGANAHHPSVRDAVSTNALSNAYFSTAFIAWESEQVRQGLSPMMSPVVHDQRPRL